MKPFNGHRSWNAWNVSLWINNDEWLYRNAVDCIRFNASREDAAREFVSRLAAMGTIRTPDGAPFNPTNVRLAMRGM